MKKTVKLLIVTVLIGGLFSLNGCKKDKYPEPEPSPTQLSSKEAVIDASDYASWVYFSFNKGTTVTISDFQTSTDWDIAFHRDDIRTNGGLSGSGQGGIQESASEYSAIITAPETGYVVDDSLNVMYSAGMPPTYTPDVGSEEGNDWAKYNHDIHAWEIKKDVFVVKTADGKYAKIWMKNFLNDDDESGTITLEYTYQPDGSAKLE